MILSMFQSKKLLFTICFFGLITSGITQNCFECFGTNNKIPKKFTPLKSRFHLVQLYGDYSYRQTNFYKEDYNGRVGWVEGRLIFPYFSEWFYHDSKVALPDLFFTATIKDLKSITWEERIDYGAGVEWRPLKMLDRGQGVSLKPFDWLKQLRFYVVYLNGYYLKDVEKWRPTKDFRVGVEVFRECNFYSDTTKPRKGDYFWSEYWGDLSYRTTNFYINNFNTWVFGFVPKYGVKIFRNHFYTLLPYATGAIQLTGRDDYWQNRLLLGVGLRVMPFRKVKADWCATLLKSCKFYVEYERIIGYFKDVPCNVPTYDLAFGINFSINRY